MDTFLTQGTPEYIPISTAQASQTRAAIQAVNSLVIPAVTATRTFLALFDGTRNSIFAPSPDGNTIVYSNPPEGEQNTFIGRLATQLMANENVGYVGGVGAVMIGSDREKTGSYETGEGCIARAEYMYSLLQNFARNLSPGESLHLDVAGFSRGAATARHFMNLVNEKGLKDAQGNGFMNQARFECQHCCWIQWRLVKNRF